MIEVVFSDYGVEVRQHDGRLFARFDRGGVAVDMVEVEITPVDFDRVKTGESEAYTLLEIRARRP